jgi:hypothetical protein
LAFWRGQAVLKVNPSPLGPSAASLGGKLILTVTESTSISLSLPVVPQLHDNKVPAIALADISQVFSQEYQFPQPEGFCVIVPDLGPRKTYVATLSLRHGHDAERIVAESTFTTGEAAAGEPV